MQPVPDHTRNRTRNRSLRFCFRFRFRIWLAVYQFNAHFGGARLGFVLCFVFCCSRRRRVAYLARRVRTEDWRLSSSWKLGSAAVADDDDVASAARSARVRFVCRAEVSALRRSCAFRQRRQNVKSTPSPAPWDPPALASCSLALCFVVPISHSYSAVRILHFVFRVSYFRWLLFFADWFYSWLCLFFRSSCQRSSFDSIGQFTTPHTLLFYFVLFGQWKYLVKRRYTYFVEGILTLTGRRRRGRLYKVLYVYTYVYSWSVSHTEAIEPGSSICLAVRMSDCPFVYLSVCMSLYPYACPYFCLSDRMSVYLSLDMSLCLYFCLSVCPSVHIPNFLSICLSVRMSICMPVYLLVRMSVCTLIWTSRSQLLKKVETPKSAWKFPNTIC